MLKVLLTPKWIALTLVVLVLTPTFKSLSDWQYRRLAQRQAFNATVINSQAKLPTDFLALAPLGELSNKADEWRKVTATGKFLSDQQYFLRKRSLDSEAGLWVVTPFEVNSGQTITVVRGWVAAGNSATDNPKVSAIPSDELTITGWLREISPKNVTEPKDLPAKQRIGINPQFGTAYIQFESSKPALSNPEITVLPLPTLTDGPHHSYAIQWLLFMVMLDGGYLILLRNDLIERRKLPVV